MSNYIPDLYSDHKAVVIKAVHTGIIADTQSRIKNPKINPLTYR